MPESNRRRPARRLVRIGRSRSELAILLAKQAQSDHSANTTTHVINSHPLSFGATERYFLKSDSQFSTSVMGAFVSGVAVLTTNLLPSGNTS
jgi:hypothetical protein